MAGMNTLSASVDHLASPGNWNGPQKRQSPSASPPILHKDFGSALLFPGLQDVVLHLGGTDNNGNVLTTVESIDNKLTEPRLHRSNGIPWPV